MKAVAKVNMMIRTMNQKAVWGGRLLSFIAAGILLHAVQVAAQTTYTIAPTPFQTALDDSGNIVVDGCIWTYRAGTTTPIATYTNTSGTQNNNPIIADYAGRFTAYLIAGTSYKFVYESACTPPAHGTPLRTADNISGVPGSTATVDVTGTAGETIAAGNCAYLSDGSGGKTNGFWYKCDPANAYSNLTPVVGMAPSAITSATTGTIRLTGPVTGLSSLTAGADYFVGSSGALSSTLPNGNRYLGRADSTTSFLLVPNPRAAVQVWADDFRLTLTTATCITTSDVTAATTLYLTPCYGNRLDLPDSNGNPQRYTTAEISIAIPATTSQLYDVFAYSSSGTPTLELLAWTNDTTRATALVRTNGRWFKTGDLTRMYVGSVRTTTVSGQTEDSATKRYVWNMYNRAERVLQRLESTTQWNYTTATWRQANNAAANQVDIIQGLAESPIWLQANATALSSAGGGAGVHINVGIGEDSTSAPVATAIALINVFTAGSTDSNTATLNKTPAVGRHFYAWLEASEAAGTVTWYGANNTVGGNTTACGLNGRWWS